MRSNVVLVCKSITIRFGASDLLVAPLAFVLARAKYRSVTSSVWLAEGETVEEALRVFASVYAWPRF